MSISRRTALATGAAAITTAAITAPLALKSAGVKVALGGDPLRAGVQALVNEIRQELPGNAMAGVHWALHEAADRLEALPGITPVPNESWDNKPADFYRQKWVIRAVRSVGGLAS